MATYTDATLEDAAQRVKTAQRDFCRRIIELYPAGTTGEFSKGNGRVQYVVIETCSLYLPAHPRLRIRSHTGKEYFVTAYDLAKV